MNYHQLRDIYMYVCTCLLWHSLVLTLCVCMCVCMCMHAVPVWCACLVAVSLPACACMCSVHLNFCEHSKERLGLVSASFCELKCV